MLDEQESNFDHHNVIQRLLRCMCVFGKCTQKSVAGDEACLC